VQRLRWLLFMVLVPATVSSTQMLLHPMPWRSPGSWRQLVGTETFFAFPGVFVALIHPVPFRLHIFLIALTVLQHVLFQLPHALHAVHALQMEALVAKSCRMLYVLLDPSFMSLGPSSSPAQCLEDSPGFLLVYAYIALAGIATSQLVFWSEYWHKLAFLQKRRDEGLDQGASIGQGWDSGGCICVSVLQAFMCAWSSCAVAWTLLAFAFSLAPWDALPLRLLAARQAS
jgi:hypothetical protein